MKSGKKNKEDKKHEVVAPPTKPPLNNFKVIKSICVFPTVVDLDMSEMSRKSSHLDPEESK